MIYIISAFSLIQLITFGIVLVLFHKMAGTAVNYGMSKFGKRMVITKDTYSGIKIMINVRIPNYW